jgi:hypothetical protein
MLNEKIKEKFEEANKFYEDIEKTETLLKTLKSDLRRLTHEELPALLTQNGCSTGSTFKFDNGLTAELVGYMDVSIPSLTKINTEKDKTKAYLLREKRLAAFKWLNDNNLGDIIKKEIIVDYDEEVVEVLENTDASFKVDEGVHPQTLKATLKEVKGNGIELPADIFEIEEGSFVKISN